MQLMQALTFLVAGFAVVAVASDGWAQSFDCGKASTASEKAICGDSNLSKLDSDMGVRFRERVAENPGVRQTQQQWIKARDGHCSQAPLVPCLESTIKKRTRELATASSAGTFELPPLPASAAVPAPPAKVEPEKPAPAPQIAERQSGQGATCPTVIDVYDASYRSTLKNGRTDMWRLLSGYSAPMYEKAYGQFSRCVAKIKDLHRNGYDSPPGMFCECQFALNYRGKRHVDFFSVVFDVCAVSSRKYWDNTALDEALNMLSCHQKADWPLASR